MAFPVYHPPPQEPPNAFSAFYNNFMHVRNPWATQLFFEQLKARSPAERNRMLVELEKEAGRRRREQEITKRALLDFKGRTVDALIKLERMDVDLRRSEIESRTDLAQSRIGLEGVLAGLGEPSVKATTLVDQKLKELSGVFRTFRNNEAGGLATTLDIARDLDKQLGRDPNDRSFAAREMLRAIRLSPDVNKDDRESLRDAFTVLGAPVEPRQVQEFGATLPPPGPGSERRRERLSEFIFGDAPVGRGTTRQAPAPTGGATAPAAPTTIQQGQSPLQSEGAAVTPPPRFDSVEQARAAFQRGDINDAQFDAAFEQLTGQAVQPLGQTPPPPAVEEGVRPQARSTQVQSPPTPVVEERVRPQPRPTQAVGGQSRLDQLIERIGSERPQIIDPPATLLFPRPRRPQASTLEGVTAPEMADILLGIRAAQPTRSGRVPLRRLSRAVREEAAQQGETVARPTRSERRTAQIAQGLRAKGTILPGVEQRQEVEVSPVLDLDVAQARDEEAFTIRPRPTRAERRAARQVRRAPAEVIDLDVFGEDDDEAFTIQATTPPRRQAEELLKQRSIPGVQTPAVQEDEELKKFLESLTPEEREIIRARRQATGG